MWQKKGRKTIGPGRAARELGFARHVRCRSYPATPFHLTVCAESGTAVHLGSLTPCDMTLCLTQCWKRANAWAIMSMHCHASGSASGSGLLYATQATQTRRLAHPHAWLGVCRGETPPGRSGVTPRAARVRSGFSELAAINVAEAGSTRRASEVEKKSLASEPRSQAKCRGSSMWTAT